MNNIFVKNLNALSIKNPELSKKIQNYVPNELPKLVNKNSSYNLLYKGLLMHNEFNPLGEAQEIFMSSKNTPTVIHLVYGLGLGYLFQVASLKSQGSVILFEPDLNILWYTFSLVDFSEDILKTNVYFVSSLDEIASVIHKKIGIKSTPILLSLTSYRSLDVESFNNFVKNIQDIVGSFSLDLKFIKEKSFNCLLSLLRNIPSLFKEVPLSKLKDVYKGKTAVIVSAGPTLDRNIDVLKKYRDKFILFTVGTAAKTLYANGIKPDFISIIEIYDSSRQIENLDLSDVNFITEPYSNLNLRNFHFNQIFSHISCNIPINQFWGKICNIDISEYSSKGTVSYTALNSARLLGFSKIILVGQDLAYIQGHCYSKDSVYKDLYCEFNKESNKWEITAKDFEKFAEMISTNGDPEYRRNVARNRLENLNKSLYYVKGIKGDMLPTESVYATFITPLSEYTTIYNDRKYINTSMEGAQIDGFENISLEDALKDLCPVEKCNLKPSFNYDKFLIINELKSKLKELKGVIDVINKGRQIVKNLNNELQRYKKITPEILKSLKSLMVNYVYLAEECSEKSEILYFIIIAEKMEIDYKMQMIKDFTLENVKEFCETILAFYNNTELRILQVEEILNESFNTKS